jgi:hypothetical protein
MPSNMRKKISAISHDPSPFDNFGGSWLGWQKPTEWRRHGLQLTFCKVLSGAA